MHRCLYIKDYYRGICNLQSESALHRGSGTQDLDGSTKLTDCPPLDTYKQILVRLVIKTPHQDDSLLLKLFYYSIKSHRNTRFF